MCVNREYRIRSIFPGNFNKGETEAEYNQLAQQLIRKAGITFEELNCKVRDLLRGELNSPEQLHLEINASTLFYFRSILVLDHLNNIDLLLSIHVDPITDTH